MAVASVIAAHLVHPLEQPLPHQQQTRPLHRGQERELLHFIAPALGGFMLDWNGPRSVYAFMAAMYAMSVLMLFGV